MDKVLRNELHLHTKLSDDISTIGVKEIFENAERKKIKAVAFTNLNNVQDFPEIMRCSKEYEGIKVIYGAEVKYKFFPQSPVKKLTLLAKNQAGIKELYKVISTINEAYDGIINLHALQENRKNLLVGSCGTVGELFESIKQDKVPYELNKFFDYFEIFPTNDLLGCERNKKIFHLGEELGLPVVAVSNGHYLEKEDKNCCNIIKNALKKPIDTNNRFYVHTTKEMLEEFAYLGEYGAKKVVLENPQYIVDIIEKSEPLKGRNYFPIFENAYSDLEKLCYSKAYEIYGNPLPKTVRERLETELGFLSNRHFATQYLLVKKLVDFSKENSQSTMIRGAAGSTLIAFLLGISEVNPLLPHYYCDCHYFETSNLADDGFDLPKKVCSVCKKTLKTDGHNIPYEVFVGLKGDKMPDIDMNFPANFFLKIHEYIRELVGKENLVQAGTVSTISEYIAKKYIQEYELTQNISFNDEEKSGFVSKITGIKVRDGMHPGAVMIIPDNMEFEDFTPLNQSFTMQSTTHFDFHSLYNTILKQDILGYAPLDLLLELEKTTGKTTNDVEFDDPKIYELFRNGDTDGILEFESDFVKDLLIVTQPQNFNDLVKINSLCHGTNVWTENAENLIKNGICNLSEVIASRDDIFNCLTEKGMDKAHACVIMETARKGIFAKSSISKENYDMLANVLKKFELPEWYIDSLLKIRYIFTKSHSVSYVMAAVRFAWFKIYYPKEFEKALSKFGY